MKPEMSNAEAITRINRFLAYLEEIWTPQCDCDEALIRRDDITAFVIARDALKEQRPHNVSEIAREEAIDYLKWARPKNPYTQDKKNLQTAIDMAIEALKENESLARSVNEASDLLRKKRPHGEWIEKSKFDRLCKNCGQQHIGDKRFANFCPNCGADMRKEGDAE